MKVLIYCACFVSLASALHAEDYCSLVVRVINTDGRELSAPTVVKDKAGRRVVKRDEDYRPGGFRFCDLGLSPVSVTVGRNGCSEIVTVQPVLLTWGVTKTISVIYDENACSELDKLWVGRRGGPAGPSCDLLIRLVDSQHKPIPRASVRMGTSSGHTLKADQYGRVLVQIAYEDEFQGTAIADGYDSVELRQPCNRANRVADQYVTMSEAPRDEGAHAH